jgi:hypothetical protein
MAEEITRALARLRNDADRCAPLSAVAIRRRGDRRRTAARVAAVGGTVAVVGATVGTGVAVSEETGSGHAGTHAAGQPAGRGHNAELARLHAKLGTLRAQLRKELEKAQQIGPPTAGYAPAARILMLHREIGAIETRIAIVRREGGATPVATSHVTQPTASPTPRGYSRTTPTATPGAPRASTLPTPTPTPTDG